MVGRLFIEWRFFASCCAPSHRCRWAHSKTALAFEQPPTSFIGQFPSSVEPASHVPPGADTEVRADLERLAAELMVDLELDPAQISR